MTMAADTDKTIKAAYIWCSVPFKDDFTIAAALWCAGVNNESILVESLHNDTKAAIESVKRKIDCSGSINNVIERCKIVYCHAMRVPKKLVKNGFPDDADLVNMELGSIAIVDYCRLAGMPEALLVGKNTAKPEYKMVTRFVKEFQEDPTKIITETSENETRRQKLFTITAPKVQAPMTTIEINDDGTTSVRSSLTTSIRSSLQSIEVTIHKRRLEITHSSRKL